MRKVTFGVANSLDNYIARPDHAVDWLLWGDEAAAFMADFWKTIDTIVMGRVTYEVALKLSGGKKRKNPYPDMATYVCSRTLRQGRGKGAPVIAEDAAELVGKLRSQPGKDICVMGGGVLANALFEADLIDEVGLNIHPVLLGSGVPLFLPMKRQVDLELLEARPFKNGCVLVMYRVRHSARVKTRTRTRSR